MTDDDVTIRLVSADGVFKVPAPDESSMRGYPEPHSLVSPGGFVAPDGFPVGSGSSRPVSSSLPRFEASRIGYADFSGVGSSYVRPRRQGRVERALREAVRRIRLAAKMLAAGATGEEYDPDPWDE